MEVADIIKRLQQLQIEESALLAELALRATDNGVPAPSPLPTSQRNDKTTDQRRVKVGDKVLLLTGGARCRKGDTATVTKVSPKTVHFTVHRNGHNTYKRPENVQRIAPDSQE